MAIGRTGRSDLRRLTAIALRRPYVRRPRQAAVLVLGLAAIVAWQWTFLRQGDRLDEGYELTASSGLNSEHRFVYFFYYLGLYPLTSDEGHASFLAEPGYKRFSREAAERVIRERGETLLMEWDHTIRVGERGKMFLYLPDAILKGSPRPPLSVRPLHAAAFMLALCSVFAAFWWARLPLLGGVITLFAGSNPFQLHEVYAKENVFGWPMTIGLLVLALSVPLLRRHPPRTATLLLVALLIGALLGTIGQVRTEPVSILLSAVLSCLFLARTGRGRRLMVAAALVIAFVGVTRAWGLWFDAKFEEARGVVAAAGHPYDGPRDANHSFWHPVWCGLGDFDTTHGYQWLDEAAASYAHPILRSVYGLPLPEWKGERWVYPGRFWDSGHRYYQMPYEMPHYSEVLRDKVLGDIASDPAWYGGILARRAWRILTETTPLRIAISRFHLTLPGRGLFAITVIGILAAAGSGTLLRIACFPVATSLPAFLIYSGRGMSFYSWYHIVAAAIFVSVSADIGIRWVIRQTRRRR